jgi:hypothetical protein
MKEKSNQKYDDDIRPEYDFHALHVVARGPGRNNPGKVTAHLAPDVAEGVTDSEQASTIKNRELCARLDSGVWLLAFGSDSALKAYGILP